MGNVLLRSKSHFTFSMICSEQDYNKEKIYMPGLSSYSSMNYYFSGQVSLLKNAVNSGNGSEIENIVPNLKRYLMGDNIDSSVMIEANIIPDILIAIQNCDLYDSVHNKPLTKMGLFQLLQRIIETSVQSAENAIETSLLNDMCFYLKDKQCSQCASQVIDKLINHEGICVEHMITSGFITDVASNVSFLINDTNYNENQKIIYSNISILAKIIQHSNHIDDCFIDSIIRIFIFVLLKYSNNIIPSIVITITECAECLARRSEIQAQNIIKSSLAQLLSNLLKNFLLKDSWENILLMFAALSENLESGCLEYQTLLKMIDFQLVLNIFLDKHCGIGALELMNNLLTDVPEYTRIIDGEVFFEAINEFFSVSGIEPQKSAIKMCFALLYKGNDEFSALFFESTLAQDITQMLSSTSNFIIGYGITAIQSVLHRWRKNNAALIEFLQFYFSDFLNEVIEDTDDDISEDIIELAESFLEEIKDL